MLELPLLFLTTSLEGQTMAALGQEEAPEAQGKAAGKQADERRPPGDGGGGQ